MQRIDEIQRKGGSINDHHPKPGGILQIIESGADHDARLPEGGMFMIWKQTLYGLWNPFTVAARL